MNNTNTARELHIAIAMTAGYTARQIRPYIPMESRKTFAWALLMKNGPAYEVRDWANRWAIELARFVLVDLGAIETYSPGSDGLGSVFGRGSGSCVRWEGDAS